MYPEAGLAIVVLVNMNHRGSFNQIIENHLADRALKLDVISWDTKWKFIPKTFRSFTEKQPSFLMAAYAGTYRNEGYGEITLCLPSDAPDGSSNCGKVQEAYNKVDATTRIAYRWQLQSSWKRIWCSHLRLISLGDHLFMGQIGTIFSDGYGGDKSPFLAAGAEIAVRFTTQHGEVTGFEFFGAAYDDGELAHVPSLAACHARFIK